MQTMFETNEKGLLLVHRGKVRDVYDAGDGKHLLIIATDRISAFDHVLPTPIPGKGRVLTQMSNFWFDKTRHIIRNHLVDPHPYEDPGEYADLSGRSVIVRKAKPLAVEAIVRGYLAGSAWKQYRQSGQVCGITLPPGLRESDQLNRPIFTPSTKAPQGQHDENITYDDMVGLIGAELSQRVAAVSLELYRFAASLAKARGIIIADVKFEFGLVDAELVLIDELFTPDSSRFWPLEQYCPGRPQPSFDKQFVRDYLDSIGWDHNPPAPALPSDVVGRTAAKYAEALRRLTQEGLDCERD